MKDLIKNFLESLADPISEIYSEAGIQFELAIFLEEKLNQKNKKGNKAAIRLEYPVDRLLSVTKQQIKSLDLKKKEIDILIRISQEEYVAIEIKMPKKDAGVPNAMYEALRDVYFLERLRMQTNHSPYHLSKCYALLLTDNIAFRFPGRGRLPIYEWFNESIEIRRLENQNVPPNLLNKGYTGLDIIQEHRTNWKSFKNDNVTYFYYLIEI